MTSFVYVMLTLDRFYTLIHRFHTSAVSIVAFELLYFSWECLPLFFRNCCRTLESIGIKWNIGLKWINPLSTNPGKWSNALKRFLAKLPTNCLSVFDHLVGLVQKGLTMIAICVNFLSNFRIYSTCCFFIVFFISRQRLQQLNRDKLFSLVNQIF